MVRHMKLILALSLPLRVYYLMRCTHNALQGVIMNSFDSTWSYFCCVSCFWQDLQDLTLLDGMCILGGPAQRLVPFIFFSAGDLIFWSPQNSEKNRQTVTKERFFYWQLNNRPPPWLLFCEWSAATRNGPIKFDDRHGTLNHFQRAMRIAIFLFFCQWFLECSSQK